MDSSRSFAKSGQYLTFQLAGRGYGVPVTHVREINQLTEITPVPRTPVFVAGVTNLRGKIIPVVDLRLKLGLEAGQATRSTCIVVIESGARALGVIVDAVSSVIELGASQIEPAPELGDQSRLRFVLGMGKFENQVIILLDVAATLSAEELEQTQALAAA